MLTNWIGARLLPRGLRQAGALVPVVRLSGAVAPPGVLPRRSLSAAEVAPLIEAAFRMRGRAAVALLINCPGGAPVQCAMIHALIRARATATGVPVLAFAEDVMASGGYWIACAADEIYGDANSLVGSIGVISAGFGFHAVLERLGIERRVHTQGPRKAMLDPFQPERPEDVARLGAIQAEVHENFKSLVRERRGNRLKGTEDEMFSGDVWTGRQAAALGLIDGVGNAEGVLRARFGPDVRLRPVGARGTWLRRRFGFGRPAAGDGAAALLAAIEERALWSRFGL